MGIIKAVCDGCDKELVPNDENDLHPDYNGEVLCNNCKKDNKEEEIKEEIERLKDDILYSEKEIKQLEQKLNEL